MMELRASGIGVPLFTLQRALLNAYVLAGVQNCDWYGDMVPGASVHAGFPPFNPNNVGFTGQARNEGYAIFWKQNIDKFIMQRADPIDQTAATPAGWLPVVGPPVANTQSRGIWARAAPGAGGINMLPGDVTVPAVAGAQYILPVGTVVSAAGVTRAGVIVVAGGAVAAAVNLNAGDIISNGTQIGPAGLKLNNPLFGVNPIVIPGGYTLTTNLTLPAAGSVLVPQRTLRLVLSGRPPNAAGNIVNYNPAVGAVNNWTLLSFPSTAGANLWNGSRRPAYCTIKANIPAGGGLIINSYLLPFIIPP